MNQLIIVKTLTRRIQNRNHLNQRKMTATLISVMMTPLTKRRKNKNSNRRRSVSKRKKKINKNLMRRRNQLFLFLWKIKVINKRKKKHRDRYKQNKLKNHHKKITEKNIVSKALLITKLKLHLHSLIHQHKYRVMRIKTLIMKKLKTLTYMI